MALYNKLQFKLSTEVVHSIVKEAVDCESYFITEALPCSLIGMNADLMIQYIQCVPLPDGSSEVRMGSDVTFFSFRPFWPFLN